MRGLVERASHPWVATRTVVVRIGLLLAVAAGATGAAWAGPPPARKGDIAAPPVAEQKKPKQVKGRNKPEPARKHESGPRRARAASKRGASAGERGRPTPASIDPGRPHRSGPGDGPASRATAKRRSQRGERGAARAREMPESDRTREAAPVHVHVASLTPLPAAIHCPSEMVAVAGRFCIDRWEASLVDAATGEALSPYYPPDRAMTSALFDEWTRARDIAPGGTLARLLELPAPTPGSGPIRPKAVARPAAVPSGYLSGVHAAEACRAAGKRLCRADEWVTACRGQDDTPFPYGTTYRQDACNVFREEHPAHVLHGTFSHNHKDPRLNAVTFGGKPLLRRTGETADCASRWGDDAVRDMVGNLDEWIDDPEGTFLGGFYSRATRQGCDARVSGHPVDYLDYSLGVRCCADP